MTNNFEQIKQLLTFDSEDDFYYLQILKRKKENKELGSNSYVVKVYFVTSIDYLEKIMPEVIHLCEFSNARAYINPSPRSFERIAFHMLKKTTDIIMNKDYKSVRRAYNSVCGEYGNGKHKKFVIDIDDLTIDLKDVEELLRQLQVETKQEPLLVKLNTKNGVHFITKPFNVAKFKIKYPSICIHRNNPTILYCV